MPLLYTDWAEVSSSVKTAVAVCPKNRYICPQLHGVTSWKRLFCSGTVMNSSDLTFLSVSVLYVMVPNIAINRYEYRTRLHGTTLGLRSDPCCIRVPIVNHKLLARVKSFSKTRRAVAAWQSPTVLGGEQLHPPPSPASQGLGSLHSYGENRATTQIVRDTTM